MNMKSTRKTLANGLGIGLLVLLAVGLVYVTDKNRPASEPTAISSQPAAMATLSSPLDTAAASPSPVALNSPLPTTPLSPLAPPEPTVSPPSTSPTAPEPSAALQLTLLHTNDTWGYLWPCG